MTMDNVWDQLAQLHHRQLIAGEDITFHKIFLPVIIEIMQKDSDFSSYIVLDVGCGTGYLTGLISRHARKVVGLDSSRNSINIAKQHNKGVANIEFESGDIKQYSKSHANQFNFVISHLVMHVIDDLNTTLQNISNCLRHGGRFFFSVPHPCFWGLTGDVGSWNFVNINNYQYHINSIQQNSIRIGDNEFSTPHYHRTIESYISALNKSGFAVEGIIEPFPDNGLMQEYNKNLWLYPRFMFMICSKV